jgi:hydrogenase nickel incorporation protein HypA/HybF
MSFPPFSAPIMHELGIAEDIVRTAMEAPGASPANLRALRVEVGQLSSVVVPSLEMCLSAVLEDRGLDDVEVIISEIPARAQCECGESYQPESLFSECPSCGGFQREITGGREVVLDSIEVEDGKD